MSCLSYKIYSTTCVNLASVLCSTKNALGIELLQFIVGPANWSCPVTSSATMPLELVQAVDRPRLWYKIHSIMYWHWCMQVVWWKTLSILSYCNSFDEINELGSKIVDCNDSEASRRSFRVFYQIQYLLFRLFAVSTCNVFHIRCSFGGVRQILVC